MSRHLVDRSWEGETVCSYWDEEKKMEIPYGLVVCHLGLLEIREMISQSEMIGEVGSEPGYF